MSARQPILEQWIARTIQEYPSAALTFISQEKDPFRNPVGHTVRQSLTVLFDQLQGQMDPGAIEPALDAIIRLRAVQDFTASQAVRFVFALKSVLREDEPASDQARLDERIDQLALMTFDKYMQCREQLAEIRIKDSRRDIVRQSAG